MSEKKSTACPHGWECDDHEASADEDERSSCCGAYVTFSGDGDLYCKCCYAFVDGGDEVAAFTFDLGGLR